MALVYNSSTGFVNVPKKAAAPSVKRTPSPKDVERSFGKSALVPIKRTIRLDKDQKELLKRMKAGAFYSAKQLSTTEGALKSLVTKSVANMTKASGTLYFYRKEKAS
jgi:hypothetical protein